MKDFINSKLFWKFYSNSITIKSCTSRNLPNSILIDHTRYEGNDVLAEKCNHHFANIHSENAHTISDCKSFILNTFKMDFTENAPISNQSHRFLDI